jgi:methyl-accepting chemotaxis protein
MLSCFLQDQRRGVLSYCKVFENSPKSLNKLKLVPIKHLQKALATKEFQVSFRNRIMIVVALACIICTAAAVFVASARLHSEGVNALVSKSQAILSRLEASRKFIAGQGGLPATVERMIKEYPDGKLSDEAKLDVLKQVPIFASMKIGAEAADKEHYKFRIFADNPRNKDNTPTAEEEEILKRFLADPNLKEIIEEDTHSVHVYRPIKLSEAQGCLTCHGHPSTSPWGTGKDILGYQMEDWKDGYQHGVFMIESSFEAIEASTQSATMNIIFWSGGLTVLALLLAFFLIKGPIDSLNSVANSLRTAGEQVASASGEISNSSQALSSSSSEAAASIEETTASTEEVSSMIKMNANHANEAKVLSQAAQEHARTGKSEVEKLIESMSDISSSSRKIEEIISVIDDIAFQTNLLALNAAVEAARAGEQGKGFSVVAEAVRALAQRSATSAKEISDLIKDSVTKIEQGSEIAHSSGAALNEIVASVEKVALLNSEISTASTEQSAGISDINKAINELDKVTQQNAAAAEETAAASEELSAQSVQLHELVNQLAGVIDGTTTAAVPAHDDFMGTPKKGVQSYRRAA